MKHVLFILLFLLGCSDEEQDIYGCIDDTACNFNSDANYDDDSCFYSEECVDECGVPNGQGPEENFDCEGNCIVNIDCYGVCGGDALLDECFSYNVSSQVAYYFFDSITISGALIDSNDWVAAFNGNICVGSNQWLCSGSCELPVYGYHSLNELTQGYMLSGDIPTFKIYDASDSTFYDAIPSEEVLWQEGGLNQIETLIAE